MKVVSWNLLRLIGAAVEDVATLISVQKPDILLMQEATQQIEALPSLVGGHFYRLSWLGRIHGLAVWSPTHFPRPVALSLPASRLPGRLPRRRAQIIQMGEITFANVHLSHGQLLNRRQLARIAAALQGKPSAIIGDYNAVGPVMIPGFADVGPREPTHLSGNVMPVRLDRCLAHRLVCTTADALDFGPSDHRPIRLELRLAESGQAAEEPSRVRKDRLKRFYR